MHAPDRGATGAPRTGLPLPQTGGSWLAAQGRLPLAFMGLALAWLASGTALLMPGTPWGSAPGGFNGMVYGLLVILGGLLPCIAGMMCKVVPFLTWMRAYGPQVGRGPTPPATALTQPRLAKPRCSAGRLRASRASSEPRIIVLCASLPPAIPMSPV